MEPNLSEIAKQREKEKWRKIRLAKIEEVIKAWRDLFFIQDGEKFFKSSPFDDYSSFEEGIRQAYEKIWLKKGYSIESVKIIPHGPLLKQMGELLSIDYIPPQTGDVDDIRLDLLLLLDYYRSDLFEPSIEMVLDISLCKLIGVVNRLYGAAKARGETILMGRKKQEEKVASGRNVVSAAFYNLRIKNKPRYTSRRRIAKDLG